MGPRCPACALSEVDTAAASRQAVRIRLVNAVNRAARRWVSAVVAWPVRAPRMWGRAKDEPVGECRGVARAGRDGGRGEGRGGGGVPGGGGVEPIGRPAEVSQGDEGGGEHR